MKMPARLGLGVVAAANLVLGGAYALQAPWAIATWPLPTGRLSYVFIGSILAAIGAGAGWMALSGEKASLPAGFATLTIVLGGVSVYLLITDAPTGRTALLPYAVTAGVLAAVNLALFVHTHRSSAPAEGPLPLLVRASFTAFIAILVTVGLALIARTPGVMPWPLDADMSVIVGFIFFGNAWYFLYALGRPRWDAARAQLWSFLAYDVVLLVPLLGHYSAAPPELRTNVLVYAAVLVYSGALAVYYLILNARTRGWRRLPAGRDAAPRM